MAGLLATSLFEDPAAGLHEDASARLLEHPASSLLDLGPVLAAVQCGLSPGSRWRPPGGHRGHHRERPDSRDTAPRDRRPADSVPGFSHELLPGVAGILTIPVLLGLAGRFARHLAPDGRPVPEAWRAGCVRAF